LQAEDPGSAYAGKRARRIDPNASKHPMNGFVVFVQAPRRAR
jgi:hypothetical protein